jgi:peptidoglycan/LPS O-acetylase OafA/YrhL
VVRAEPRPDVEGAPPDDNDVVVTHADTRKLFTYHPALDGIRALAVLAIILYHDNYSWVKGAFLSVDTFFLLSGFLITTLLILEYRRRAAIKLTSFYERRARRLLPALLLLIAVMAIYNHVVVLPWDRLNVRNDMFASLFYFANWRFIADKQGYFELFQVASPLRHMWTLAIEEQYYLIWPLIVFGCMRLARGSVKVLVGFCIVGVFASIYAMQARFVVGDPSAAYYATDARAHTILIGALTAIALLSFPPSARAGRVLALIAIPAFFFTLFLWYWASGTSSTYYHGGSPLYAIMGAFIMAGALQPGLVQRILAFGPLPWIGRISYGLYLWHWPITVWLIPTRLHVGDTELVMLRLALTFAAATLSYYLVEKPIRDGWRFRRIWTLALFVPAVLAVVALTVWSGTSYGPPPSYIWGLGDPLVCGTPRPAETKEAVDANTKAGPLQLPSDASKQRLLLVGDSSACSLWPGLDAAATSAGMTADKGSVFGCGVASGQITTTRNEPITPHSERCPVLTDETETKALAAARPTTVIWMSIWEKSDLVDGTKTIVAGTPEWEREINDRMDAALARLRAGGAHVVLVTEAAPAPNPAQATQGTNDVNENAGYGRLNDLLRRFQARHPKDVSLVDLATKVCPSGPPCPENVEGLHARPDGHHFTPAASTWAARWLLEQMFAGNR